MKHFLVVVDMQTDFIDGSLGTAEAAAIVPAAAEKIRGFDGQVIATLDTHGPDYLTTSEGRKLPVEHCIKGSQGWEIVPQLAVFKAVAKAVVEKPTFGSTKLAQAVADYDEIELVGLCTDICVISNALLLKAFWPEKDISVDASCCAGVTPKSHENALEAMKMCQIEVEQG